MNDKPELYLIVLQGGGDVEVKVVDKETFDYIDSPRPEFEDGSYSCYESSVPEAIIKRRARYYDHENGTWPDDEKEHEQYPCVTTGSCENDRALWVPAIEHNGTFLNFDDVAEAINWFSQNGFKCAETWEGYIY